MDKREEENSYMIELVPSILSADFTRLGEQVREVEKAGARRIQIDVMDGHFVPNITMGPMVVEAVRRCTNATLETHLMITNPERYIETFAKAGADLIIVHYEVCPHLHSVIQQIRKAGKQVGVALNPSTPVFMLEDMISLIDLLLVMTINPGFGGQELIPEMLPKITKARQMITERGLHCDIEVDGGVHEGTVPLVVGAGANLLVAGSAIYSNKESVSQAMARLQAAW
jgi:ribulose-phosphate 3-epimerase